MKTFDQIILNEIVKVADQNRLGLEVSPEKVHCTLHLTFMQNLDAQEHLRIAEAAVRMGKLLSVLTSHTGFQLISLRHGRLTSACYYTCLHEWQKHPDLKAWIERLHNTI